MFEGYEIRQIPLTLSFEKKKIERFLSENGLRLEEVDYYAGVFRGDDSEILAGGGFQGNILKCLAVSDVLRDSGMGSKLISHLVNSAIARSGSSTIRTFTKTSNIDIFQSLGFQTIAKTSKALLMEMGSSEINKYKAYLQGLRRSGSSENPEISGRNGAIVMNGNPFTLGHRYLIEKAASQVDNLYVIMVSEDRSLFSAKERFDMAVEGTSDLPNVTICRGSSYAVSALTFPTYFIKEVEEASSVQISLDLDIFARHIAPSLEVSIRFVGSEPSDKLTALYNTLMHEQLPPKGVEVIEIERIKSEEEAISASRVRKFIESGKTSEALKHVPRTTWPYIIAHSASLALEQELKLTPKPGLIDASDNGAHKDMNFAIMSRSIKALHPYFLRLSLLGFRSDEPSSTEVVAIGLEAEKAMLEATGGVNTHKGALFSLGLMAVVAAHELYKHGNIDKFALREGIIRLAEGITPDNGSHGGKLRAAHGLKGALDMARDGYQDLFAVWMPVLRDNNGDPYAMHKTLLAIMSSLDDTNVCHRSGFESMNSVKDEALQLWQNFSIEGLERMNSSFISRNISPGGAADMLALTIFANGLC